MPRISVAIGDLPKRLKTKKEKNMVKAAMFFKERVEEAISKPGPSAPGQFPGIKTGRMRRSIKIRREKRVLRIVVDVPYASYLEYGTRRMAARPFLNKLWNKHRRRMAGIIRRGY